MNWYKLAQGYYEDVSREDYEDDEIYEAEKYFSIGQNDDEEIDQTKNICWIWIDNQLFTHIGPGSHQMFFRHLMGNKDVENFYRGWYDKSQELLSVVVTNHSAINNLTEEDIPPIIRRTLRRTFGDNFEFKVF